MGYDDKFEGYDEQLRRHASRTPLEIVEQQHADMVRQYNEHMDAMRRAAVLLRIVYFLTGTIAGGAAVWFVLSR